MGKDLHYSIRPFIENALKHHHVVKEVKSIQIDNFYAYEVIRNGMDSVIVVLSDDYFFGENAIQKKPEILKDGGFFLKARPEGGGIEKSIPAEKLGIGRIGKLLGALNRNDFWNYEPTKKD